MSIDSSTLSLTSWLHVWPLWEIGAAIFASLVALSGLGYHGARWSRRKRGSAPQGKNGSDGRDFLLTAMLGLMALLLAFTFSLALDRFETRRDLVVTEANALETAWMFAQALQEPDRIIVTKALRNYLEARVIWSQTYTDRNDMGATKELQIPLWNATITAAHNEPTLAISTGLTTAVSASFDIATKRLAARTAKIPDSVLHTLLLYIAIAVLILGEVTAAHDKKPHHFSTTLLLLLLTLALMIILDLDRTNSGAIMVSQQPMLDLWEGAR
ncbi:MAG: hypothetical protein LBV36_08900 [Chromatiales bacterium]|jgi:hypothetical protein|nr:hypothetical protein [Chromatiales bacterium]